MLVAGFDIGILIQLVVGIIAGVLIGILAKLPIIGLVGGLVDLYVLAGIIIQILVFAKVIKD